MKTVSSNYLQSFYTTCIEAGAKENDLLPLIPAGQQAMKTPDYRFPVDCVSDILTKTEQVTGNQAIGLMAGKGFRPSTFLDVGHAIMFCRSLRHAILINRRYQPITQQFGRTNLKIYGKQAWLHWDSYCGEPEYCRNLTDAVMASHAQFGRWLTWVHDKKINAVHFRHKQTSYTDQYEALFECPVLFEQEHDAMIVDVEAIDMPLPQANAGMLTDICKRLDQMLQAVENPNSWRDMMSNLMSVELIKGLPDLEYCAHKLGVSGRTLRRHLSNEGTSYRVVLEQTRREMCDQFLVERILSLTEIAERIGYSEQSAFNRAFKGWYGETPKAYTRAIRAFDKAFEQLAP